MNVSRSDLQGIEDHPLPGGACLVYDTGGSSLYG
jgi:hypothetical protein